MSRSLRVVLMLCSIAVAACGGHTPEPGTILGVPIEGNATTSVAIADFDGDGFDDIAAGRYDLTGSGRPFTSWIEILNQNRLNPGSFTTVSTESVADDIWSVVSADLDGDGNDDLVSTNLSRDSISIVMNDAGSPGSFRPASTLNTSAGVDAVAIGDINGDSVADIAVSDVELSVFLQDAANPGSYTRHSSRAASASPLRNVALGDFNFDGREDLAVITVNGAGMTDGIELWLQDQILDASFTPGPTYGVSDQPTTLAVADLNVDGFDDAVTGSQDTAQLTVFLNNPGTPGTFSGPAFHATCGPGESVTIADANNDALPDIIMAGWRNGEACIAVHLQNSAAIGTFQPADYYVGTGIVSDFSVATGDLNGDGLLDIAIADSGIAVFLQNPASPGVFQPQRRILTDD